MILQQLIRTDAEKVFVVGQNCSNATLVGNSLVCFDGILASSVSFGNGFNNPVTSNLGLFAGVVDADITSIGSTNPFGLIQVYGARQSIAAAATTNNSSISAMGLVMGPAAAKVSAQSNGATFALGPIVIMDNDISGAGYFRGFIRAL